MKLNNNIPEKNMPQENLDVIKYVAIGDSYTIGNGVAEADRWPNVLVKHLKETGVKVELVANPAVSGFTVQEAMDYEIGAIEKFQPDFVTILIGANDNFQGVDVFEYKANLQKLLDLLQDTLKDEAKILLVSVPDYTASPAARSYDPYEVLRVRKSIELYNNVIKEEAQKRGFGYIDIFPLSQTMSESEFYISDGLHPSAKGYALWEKEIYPVALEILN
jgi:lysophospholipase L1-like esterase